MQSGAQSQVHPGTPVISVRGSGHGLWILLSKNECVRARSLARANLARGRSRQVSGAVEYDNNVSCMSTSHKYVKPFRLEDVRANSGLAKKDTMCKKSTIFVISS